MSEDERPQQFGRTDAFRTFDEAWAEMQMITKALDGRVVWTQRPQVRRYGRLFSWDGLGVVTQAAR